MAMTISTTKIITATSHPLIPVVGVVVVGDADVIIDVVGVVTSVEATVKLIGGLVTPDMVAVILAVPAAMPVARPV